MLSGADRFPLWFTSPRRTGVLDQLGASKITVFWIALGGIDEIARTSSTQHLPEGRAGPHQPAVRCVPAPSF